MTEDAVVTDKGLQLKVLAGLALGVVLMIGTVQLFLETSTLRNASMILAIAMLIVIGYLAIDL